MPKANDVPVNVIIVEKRIRRLASISRRYLSNPRFVFAIGLFGVCSLFGILRTDLLRPLAQHDHSTYHPSFNWMSSALDWNSEDTAPAKAIDPNFEVNDYFQNDGLLVRKDRDRNVPDSELKTILMWNDAYGSRTYDIGHGREPFYKYKCPETRCYATSNRTYLKSVADFDALIIHQRGIDWKDMPKERKPHQR